MHSPRPNLPDAWRPAFRALPVVAALLPVLIASALGWLPQIRVFGLGAFILAVVAIWMPQTWKMFAVLIVANAAGAIALVASAHLASPYWLAALFLAVVGYAGGILTKRFGALVPLIVTAGAVCGLGIPAGSAIREALLLALGGLWSIICGLGIPRPSDPAPKKRPEPIPMPRFYAWRYGLSVGLALVLGHWIWPGHLGWAPASAAVVLSPDLAATGRRGAWRVVATLAAVVLSAALLAVHMPAFPALAFLVFLLCVAHAFELDPMYTIPVVTTTIVLTVLGYANPEGIGAAFAQRTVLTTLGVAVAWALVRIPK
jgi:hypothetical protein